MSRELDAEVAEKVMGTTLRFECDTYKIGYCDGVNKVRCGACGQRGHGNCYGNGVGAIMLKCADNCPSPSYSEDISAAFLVVEKMRERGFQFELIRFCDDQWRARFCDRTYVIDGVAASVDSAPEAICRAALAALGAGKGQGK